MQGWGAVYLSKQTGGRWADVEQKLHINALELLAIEYALKSFEASLSGKHVKILTDNTCAVSYLRSMGGSQSILCNEISHRIWVWCQKRRIWLTISHIPGKSNVEADRQSRTFNDRTEWRLDPNIFRRLTKVFGTPSIDLFASRLNYQVKPDVAWGPDPEALAVDAFSIHWGQFKVYAFPPFCLLHRVLNKWRIDQADGIVIAPFRTTASWYPMLLRMLTDPPVLLPKEPQTLRLPHNNEHHPLHKQLQLMACRLSGKPSRHREFMDRLLISFGHPGVQQQKLNMPLTSPAGVCSVLRRVTIPFVHL